MKKRKIKRSTHFVLLITILAFSFKTMAQDESVVLRGTIGKYPVTLSIEKDNQNISARYFYNSTSKTIRLDSCSQNGRLLVLSTNSYFDENQEKFVLNVNANKYAGYWTNNRNKKLAVYLYKINTTRLQSPLEKYPYIKSLKQNEPFEYLRLYQLNIKSDSVALQDGRKISWLVDSRHDIKMFQLKDGYSAAVIKSVNDSLSKLFFQEIQNKLSCSSPFGEGEYELSVKNIFLSKNIISLCLSVSYYCGGAHPDFGLITANFNAQNGQPLELDKIIRFNDERIPEKGTDEWYPYRSDNFAKAVVALFQKLHPKEMKPSDEEACRYDDPEVWNFPSWYFTKEGLVLEPMFARVMRVCDNPGWGVIPYAQLKKIKNPSFHLSFP